LSRHKHKPDEQLLIVKPLAPLIPALDAFWDLYAANRSHATPPWPSVGASIAGLVASGLLTKQQADDLVNFFETEQGQPVAVALEENAEDYFQKLEALEQEIEEALG
jgi:hypothetical protein